MLNESLIIDLKAVLNKFLIANLRAELNKNLIDFKAVLKT